MRFLIPLRYFRNDNFIGDAVREGEIPHSASLHSE
jgi:hypothetical protein